MAQLHGSHARLRRSLIGSLSVLAVATVATLPMLANAQSAYPSKPITFVVPLAVGGAADSLARIWADYASRQLGVPVVVKNRPGANGSIAASYVAQQAPDGYTLLMATMSNMAFNQFSYKSLTYKASDFEGVGMLATTSQVLVTNPAAGFRSVDDLVAKAKANPGVLAFGSAGTGNSTHLNIEIFARHYGLQFTHAPYGGAAPALVGVMGGETQMMSDAVTSAVPQARGGKIVPLMVFGPARIAALPDVPTAAELGITKIVGGGWYAVAVPAGTPNDIVEKLNATTKGMWQDPAVKEKLEAIYMSPMPDQSPGAMNAAVAEDVANWQPLFKELGIQFD